MTRIVFIDLRNKLHDEMDLMRHIDESDFIISLTPYSNYLLEKLRLEFIRFSKLKDKTQFHFDVLSDYEKIEKRNNFKKLGSAQFVLRDIAKYVTFEHYLRIVKKYTKNKYCVYISSCDDGNAFGKNALLNQFIKFSESVSLDSDKFFYKRNKISSVINKIINTSFFDIYKRLKYQKDFNYDNKINIQDYKKINFKIESKVDFDSIKKYAMDITNGIVTDPTLKNFLYNELSTLITHKKVKSNYIPFTFLNGVDLYSRFLVYKKNNIPTLFMQHGSYVHENYFLRYNEIIHSDVNFVFNIYSKNLFERLGAKKVYCVGSENYNKKIRARKKEYDYVYITYCTQYNYPGFAIGSKDFVLSPVAEDIYQRHKDVIESFGEIHTDKKICIKVQQGIFLASQIYVPLKELAEKYPNVTIEFSEPLFSLIEKSKYIISDYFSSEFSNQNVLNERNIILFGDIIKINDKDVLRDFKDIFITVNNISEMNDVIKNFDFSLKTENKKRNLALIRKYSTSNLNTQKEVKEIINNYL